MRQTKVLHPTTSERHRFHFLDALRGVASVLVLMRHTLDHFFVLPSNTYLAVDFFFCLSGFVVAFSYESRLRDMLNLRDFLAARTIRLYPTYCFCVVCGAIPYLFLNSKALRSPAAVGPYLMLLFAQLLMIPNVGFYPDGMLFPLDFTAWSLFGEVVANVVYGAAVRHRLAHSASLMALAAVCMALLWACTPAVDSFNFGVQHRLLDSLGLARVGFSFSVGVLVLRLYRGDRRTYLSPAQSSLAAAVLSVVFAFLLVSPFEAMRSKAFLAASVGLFFPCILYAAAHCRVPESWTPSCIFLGNVSYPLYLVQAPLLRLLDVDQLRPHALHRPWLAIAFLLTGSVLIAHLIYRYYDVSVRSLLTRRYNTWLVAHAPAETAS